MKETDRYNRGDAPGNRQNYRDDRSDNRQDRVDDSRDYRDDVRDDRRDYHDDVRSDRGEYYDDRYRYRGGYRYYEHYDAGAFAAGLVVGTALSTSAYRSAYPSGCVATFVGNTTYYQCGTTWYQREYASGGTTYIVVNNPTP